MPMNFAIIEDNKVVNIARAESALADNWIASDVAKIGDEYINSQFVTPPPDTSALEKQVRLQRNFLIADSDWRVVKAAEVGATLDPAWVLYRQELRDVPQQAGFPTQINWPTPPGGA